jgi:hypothetical protein
MIILSKSSLKNNKKYSLHNHPLVAASLLCPPTSLVWFFLVKRNFDPSLEIVKFIQIFFKRGFNCDFSNKKPFNSGSNTLTSEPD